MLQCSERVRIKNVMISPRLGSEKCTRTLVAQTFWTPPGSGTSLQNSHDIPDSSLRNPRKTNFRGRARTFRPQDPLPTRRSPGQKSYLCALFSCLKDNGSFQRTSLSSAPGKAKKQRSTKSLGEALVLEAEGARVLKPTGSWEDVYHGRQIARAYCLYLIKFEGWNSGFVVLHRLLSKPRRWFVAGLRIRDPKVVDQGGVVFQLKYWQCSVELQCMDAPFSLEAGGLANGLTAIEFCNYNIWHNMLKCSAFPVCLIKAAAIHPFRTMSYHAATFRQSS